MLLQQSDFEAGKVQLEFQVVASPLGANRPLLESNLSGEVLLTQRRSMEVAVTLDQDTVSTAGGQLLSCFMKNACLSLLRSGLFWKLACYGGADGLLMYATQTTALACTSLWADPGMWPQMVVCVSACDACNS